MRCGWVHPPSLGRRQLFATSVEISGIIFSFTLGNATPARNLKELFIIKSM